MLKLRNASRWLPYLRSAPLVGTPLTLKTLWPRWLQVLGWRCYRNCFGLVPWWLQGSHHKFGENSYQDNKNLWQLIGQTRFKKMWKNILQEFLRCICLYSLTFYFLYILFRQFLPSLVACTSPRFTGSLNLTTKKTDMTPAGNVKSVPHYSPYQILNYLFFTCLSWPVLPLFVFSISRVAMIQVHTALLLCELVQAGNGWIEHSRGFILPPVWDPRSLMTGIWSHVGVWSDASIKILRFSDVGSCCAMYLAGRPQGMKSSGEAEQADSQEPSHLAKFLRSGERLLKNTWPRIQAV